MDTVTLDQLEPGQLGIVVRVSGQGATRRRMLDLGLTSGAEIAVVRRGPLGDPTEFQVRGYSLSLRRNEAREIHVQLVQEAA